MDFKIISRTLLAVFISAFSAYVFYPYQNLVYAQSLSGFLRHPDNPYLVFSNGKYVISFANNNHGAPLDTMLSFGFTHYEKDFRWFDGKGPEWGGEAMLQNHRFPATGNINFNEGFFNELRSQLDKAKARGISISFVLFSGPAFEADRTPGSRWTGNPWNSLLGGPIEASNSGFREFLTLENYDYNSPLTSRYSSYDSAWPQSRRVQYRIEEIVNKLVEEIGNYDNWAINMFWEMDDNPSEQLMTDWGRWFAGYIHKKNPKRLVFTGEEDNANFASKISTADGSQHEGTLVYGGDVGAIGRTANGKPKIVVGYDPFNKNGSNEDKLCLNNPDGISAEYNINYMRKAVLSGRGVHPGTPFHFVYCSRTSDGKKIMEYVKVLQAFLATVDSWHNEPGDEVNDNTVPTFSNYASFNVDANDFPDSDGKKGWPRHGGVSSPPPGAKPGDLNGDGFVDVIDLGILLSNWGKTSKPPSDLNQDGKVDVIDLGILLSNWG